jgi:hypothetical protein
MEAESIEYERGLTFEKVWTTIQEMSKAAEQRSKEMEQRSKETDRKFQEIALSFKETERFLKDIGQQIGGLHRNFGELAEHLVAPGIVKRFNELGFHFQSIAEGNYKILKPNGTIRAEIDLLLENTQHIIAVEVKTKPTEWDIAYHIERLKILREHKDAQHDPRKIRGALAGAVFPREVKRLTLEAGLYVLEQSGDTMQIEAPEAFVLKEW